MAHGDPRVGKWRGNWRMDWVASTLHTTSEYGVSSITTADAHTSAACSRLNWRPPVDLNGLVRFAERRNLISARVPSHFNSHLLSFKLSSGDNSDIRWPCGQSVSQCSMSVQNVTATPISSQSTSSKSLCLQPLRSLPSARSSNLI